MHEARTTHTHTHTHEYVDMERYICIRHTHRHIHTHTNDTHIHTHAHAHLFNNYTQFLPTVFCYKDIKCKQIGTERKTMKLKRIARRVSCAMKASKPKHCVQSMSTHLFTHVHIANSAKGQEKDKIRYTNFQSEKKNVTPTRF